MFKQKDREGTCSTMVSRNRCCQIIFEMNGTHIYFHVPLRTAHSRGVGRGDYMCMTSSWSVLDCSALL